jgi:proline iminopeptidase
MASAPCLAWRAASALVVLSAAPHATALVAGEGYATSDGVRIWYRVEGTASSGATPLLFVHGGPGATARPFERTIGPQIARGRPVVYMDYRGAGRSERPKDPSQYSLDILAGDVEAVRRHLGISRWAVFGHSNGGATAITYTLREPGHVAALVLCDPLLSPADLEMNMLHKVARAPAPVYEKARAIYRSPGSAEARFGQLLDLMDQRTRDGFQFFDPASAAVLGRLQGELAQELGRGLMEPALIQGLVESGLFEFDAFRSAARIECPVLLLLGLHDSEISVDNAMRFALAVPDGYCAVLDRSGHHPYLEQTAASAERVAAFLASRADTRSTAR